MVGVNLIGLLIIGGLLLLLFGFTYVMIGGVLRNKKEK